MQLEFHQIDAFTDRPFRGNPAVVYRLDAWLEDELMQRIAAEHNQAETAFTVREGSGWRIRWFTPACEVPLCGHATLASAHILWQSGAVPAASTIQFFTLSGLLTADQRGGLIWLNFPSRPAVSAEPPSGMLAALGVKAVFVGRSLEDYLVETASEAEVLSSRPDFNALARVQARGVILTSQAEDGRVDFISRFFAPAVGVNEDPVTGSAHTALTPYWSAKLGKTDLRARQVSERGGDLRLQNNGERVSILGQAVTVFRAELFAPPA